MSQIQVTITAPVQHDLDGGSCLTASVSDIGNGDFAIVVDGRDAANVSLALLNTKFDNRDDREAAHKLAQLIEEALEA